MVASAEQNLLEFPAVPRVPRAGRSDLWLAAADRLRPPLRVNTAEWCEANLIIPEEISARPGPLSCDYKPWTRDLHNARCEHRDKIGAIITKPEQAGATAALLHDLLCLAATDPGPMLYITSDDEKAGEVASRYFSPMIANSRALRAVFGAGSLTQRETMRALPFPGGVLRVYGAGSESKVISYPYRYVVLDEYQLSSENFPAASGDLYMTAFGRGKTYRQSGQAYIWINSHPRFAYQDIDKLRCTLSDQRVWSFDCPACKHTFAPVVSRHVRFGGIVAGDAEGRPDPATARLHCPGCDHAISDAERARAVWPARLGGTGRFVSELEDDEANRRPFAGRHIGILCDPSARVFDLAKELADCATEQERQSFYNKRCGETYAATRGHVTLDTITKCLRATDRIIVPGGERGVRFLCVGADVQAPKHHPTIYAAAIAYAPAVAYVVALQICSGWAAYHAWLCELGVALAGTDGLALTGPGSRIAPRLAAIDAGYETGQVLDQSRRHLVSSVEPRAVPQLALRFVPHLNADNPAVEAPERKRTHPTRPELGLAEYTYLHRHSWVDRFIRRMQEGRMVVLCPTPPEFISHVLSNKLTPVKNVHGWEPDKVEWNRNEKERDDWMMAMVYAEAGAALKCHLDTMHAAELRAQAGENMKPQTPSDRLPGDRIGLAKWMGHNLRGKGNWWRV